MRCPACGFENPPRMRFCGQCATALAPARISGEARKIVTVLFADVVGSTRLSGAVDPERMRAQMARFFDVAREEISRYGGTVEKFIGDAVMAVFGLPVIHEDDPERAARAAAALREAVRSEIESGGLPEIRIGINTGEVVADAQATDRGEFLVTGEVVNLAARLQQHAAPGQILIGERTMLALHGIAQLRPIPPLAVKGAAVPLPAWALVDIAPRRERDVRTPFVGRAEEVALLRGYVRRMRREGRGHVVTILGQAGTGKTRLMQEFRAQTDDVRILLGRALAYGTGVPLWALGEAVKEECGILMGDPLEIARTKLQDAVARIGAAGAVPALLTVLGLSAEGHELAREVLFAGMRSFFHALARQTPLLLILEDVHSAEDVTLDFIEYAADWLREVPMFLLVLSRHELVERRPTWMGGKQSATTLFLDPLPRKESDELVRAILHKPAPDPLVEQVLERAEGNPLFMEEMLRALVDRGVLAEEADRWVITVPLVQVNIPDTVHAVIAARIDSLPADEKQALQTAAVVGNDFSLGAVRFIAGEHHRDEAVRALVSKDILVPRQQSVTRGEEEFTFRHILIRDVAYAMLPKAQRWPQHALCAEWQQQIAGDRRAEYADSVAHHWLQVITLREDLGLPPDVSAREQAIANLLLAGGRAAGLYANTTALDRYSRALELEPQPSRRLQALLGRGQVWMLLGQYGRAREDFAAARTLARESGERRSEAIALDHLGHSYRQQDQIAHALQHLEPALALSREVGDPVLTGRILNHIGFAYFNAGRHEDAIRDHEEARRLLEGCGDLAGLAESLHGLGDNYLFLGRFKESVQWCSESARVCDRIGNRSLAGENRYMIAGAQEMLAEYAEALSEVERSAAGLAEIGDAWNLSFALHVAARVATCLGQMGKALEYANRGVVLARQINASRQAYVTRQTLGALLREMEDFHGAWQVDHEAVDLARVGEVGSFWMPRLLSALVLDAIALGRMDDAKTHAEEARRILAEGPRRLDYPLEVTHAEGRMLLALGRAAEARQTADVLLEMIASTHALHWRVPALLLSADATVAIGDLVTAGRTLRAAAEEAERQGRVPALWRALAGLAEAQRLLGQAQESAASAGRAARIVDRLAANMPDERLRAAFLRSAKVQRVVAMAGA